MSVPTATDARESRVRKAQATYSSSLLAWLFKIICLAVVDAAAVFALMTLAAEGRWVILSVVAIASLLINLVYLVPNRFLPAKYLTPGLIFLLIYSVLAIIYTAYISVTNQSDGHIITKSDAIPAIMANNQVRVEGSAAYKSAVARKDGELWLIAVDPATKKVLVGNNETPMAEVSDAQVTSLGAPKEVPGYTILSFAELSKDSKAVTGLQAALKADDPNAGYLHTTTGSQAYVYKSTMTYDKAADTMTDAEGVVYRDTGNGSYTSDTGKELMPGWRITVGAKNYTDAVTNADIRAPLLRIVTWTFAFAILSVVTTFVLGLALAIMFNDQRMRGQKLYRTLMIMPYAFPGFLSGLVWMGMFNKEFGFINQVLLGGASIPWLTDPTLAKIAILIVNLWLGYPYMFLVCTGALQAIPDEVLEASRVDGATAWQTFRNIKLPLLMVPLAPLLISSFAYNFNNFPLIFMLTGGGPRFEDTQLNVGATDILITMVYKLSGFAGGAHEYGLASAMSIIIFLIVGVISYLGFRQTRALEELN